MIVDALPYLAAVMGRPGAPPEQVKAMMGQIRDGMAAGGEGYARSLDATLARMVSRADDRAVVRAWGLATDPGVAARFYYEDVLLDLRPGLAKVRAPMVLLYPDNVPSGAPAGMMDTAYTAAYAAAPSVKPHRVDNALHFIMLDQPAAFSKELDAFLAQ